MHGHFGRAASLLNSNRVYWLFVFLFAFAYLLMVVGSPLTVRGWSNHDDLFFLRMAYSLLNTGWFGPYDQMTLMKGPAYPAFIAANFVLGLPLLLTTQLVFVSGCVALAGTLTLYPIPRAAALLCYVVVLFNPITFTPEAFAGMRTEIYLAWTLLAVAGWLALPVGAGRWTKSNIAATAVGTGVAFSAFWLTREESIWLVPSMALFAAVFAFLYWWRGRVFTLRRYGLGILISVLTFAAINLSISAVNYRHYRYFGTVDIRASGYIAAYQALSRVRPAEWKHHLPVPREVRERIYAVSPAFAELRAGVEGSGFKQQACSFEYIKYACGDLASGWFLFALRDAVADAGYYRRGDFAEQYYKRLVKEVNEACDQGKLVCDSFGYAFIPPLSKTILSMTWDSLKEVMARVAFFRTMPLGPNPGSGYELFPYVAGITHNRLTPTQTEGDTLYGQSGNMRAIGWVYHRDGEVSIRIESGATGFAGSVIRRVPRSDIESMTKDPRAAKAGFDIEYRCPDPCFFVVRTASGTEARFPVPRSAADKGSDSNGFSMRYDFWEDGKAANPNVRIPPPAVLDGALDAKKRAWRGAVAAVYQAVMPAGLVAALVMLAIATWQRVRRRDFFGPEVLLLGFVVAAAATRAVMIALLDAVLTAPNGTSYDYISPAFTLYGLALALCIALPFAGRPRNAVSGSPGNDAGSPAAQTGAA